MIARLTLDRKTGAETSCITRCTSFPITVTTSSSHYYYYFVLPLPLNLSIVPLCHCTCHTWSEKLMPKQLYIQVGMSRFLASHVALKMYVNSREVSWAADAKNLQRQQAPVSETTYLYNTKIYAAFTTLPLQTLTPPAPFVLYSQRVQPVTRRHVKCFRDFHLIRVLEEPALCRVAQLLFMRHLVLALDAQLLHEHNLGPLVERR